MLEFNYFMNVPSAHITIIRFRSQYNQIYRGDSEVGGLNRSTWFKDDLYEATTWGFEIRLAPVRSILWTHDLIWLILFFLMRNVRVVLVKVYHYATSFFSRFYHNYFSIHKFIWRIIFFLSWSFVVAQNICHLICINCNTTIFC